MLSLLTRKPIPSDRIYIYDGVIVASLVREAETAFVDVYSISGMGRMRAQA